MLDKISAGELEAHGEETNDEDNAQELERDLVTGLFVLTKGARVECVCAVRTKSNAKECSKDGLADEELVLDNEGDHGELEVRFRQLWLYERPDSTDQNQECANDEVSEGEGRYLWQRC